MMRRVVQDDRVSFYGPTDVKGISNTISEPVEVTHLHWPVNRVDVRSIKQVYEIEDKINDASRMYILEEPSSSDNELRKSSWLWTGLVSEK
jgi:hypothetical protein